MLHTLIDRCVCLCRCQFLLDSFVQAYQLELVGATWFRVTTDSYLKYQRCSDECQEQWIVYLLCHGEWGSFSRISKHQITSFQSMFISALYCCVGVWNIYNCQLPFRIVKDFRIFFYNLFIFLPTFTCVLLWYRGITIHKRSNCNFVVCFECCLNILLFISSQ